MDLSLKMHFQFLIIFCPDAAGELASLVMGRFLRSNNRQAASSRDREWRSEVSVKRALKSEARFKTANLYGAEEKHQMLLC